MAESNSFESDAGSDLGNDESDSSESMRHMIFIEVEYYRSVKYSLKWTDSMNPKRNFKRRKISKDQDGFGSSEEESIQRRLVGKRNQKGTKKTQAEDRRVSADELSGLDLIDIIDKQHQIEENPEENGPLLMEVADDELDQSDDDRASVSSVMSGPSVPFNITEKPQILCSACRKLYQKAKRMKAPLKHKLLNTNPKSLTCDQWILLKPRRRKRINIRVNRLVLTQLILKMCVVAKGLKKSEPAAKEVCSRPRVFLQRNLQHVHKVPLKKEKRKSRKKRPREDSQGSRYTKQQRLHSNHRQPIGSGDTHNSLEPVHSSCSSLSSATELENSDLTIKGPTVSSTFPKQSVPKKAGGFRDLLAQLRGNNSMVISETRY